MFGRLFHRNNRNLSRARPGDGWIEVASPEALLTPHIPTLTAAIRSLVGVPDAHWDRLYRPLFENLAGFVQRLPASEAHHHSGPGGLLRHALEVAHEAMKLRRGALLPPGASAEELARLQDVWTYACVSAALLHDIGKPLADQRISLFDADRAPLGEWSPTDGPIRPPARYYRVDFVTPRRYRRHERLTPLLANHIVPAEGLRWMAGEPAVMDAWMATLLGEYEEAGPLGAIVTRADGLSVARDLSGGDRVQMPTARMKPLSERLITALRHLLTREDLPLNRRGAAGFLVDEDLWLVSKRVLDAIKEHLAREGQTGVPSRNDRLMDELQQHGLIVPNGDRAIWTCEVRIGDWSQRLTLLRLEASLIWPDPERRPPSLEGVVMPVGEEEQDNQPGVDEAGAGDPQPSGAAAQADSEPGGAGMEPGDTRPQDAGGKAAWDGLPMPPGIGDTRDGANPGPREASQADPESVAQADPGSGGAGADQDVPPTLPGTGGTQAQANPENPPETPSSPPQDTDPGARFVAWLRDNIASGRVEINTVNARLHVLPEGLAMITPGIFRDFDPERWDRAQKRFQKQKLHRRRPDGTNIWTCLVTKQRKQSRIKVMLIPEPEKALGVSLPPPNPVVTLLTGEGGQAGQKPKEAGDGQAV